MHIKEKGWTDFDEARFIDELGTLTPRTLIGCELEETLGLYRKALIERRATGQCDFDIYAAIHKVEERMRSLAATRAIRDLVGSVR